MMTAAAASAPGPAPSARQAPTSLAPMTDISCPSHSQMLAGVQPGYPTSRIIPPRHLAFHVTVQLTVLLPRLRKAVTMTPLSSPRAALLPPR